jgi:hypothetical protein
MSDNLLENVRYLGVMQSNKENIQNAAPDEKKRGKYFKSYSEQNLQTAISEVQSGEQTIYGASKKHLIPLKTLWNRIKGKSSAKHGNSTLLSIETEQLLVDWIVQCARMGDPRTKDQVIRAAAACAKAENGKDCKGDVPSSHWMANFINRNPSVSFRTPSSLTRAAANVSQSDIINYINNVRDDLKTMLKENFDEVMNDPSAFGNTDETNFELNPVPSKVLANKGSRNVYRVETAKPKERVTATFTFLATGEVLTPQLIFKKSFSRTPEVSYACGGKINTLHRIN